MQRQGRPAARAPTDSQDEYATHTPDNNGYSSSSNHPSFFFDLDCIDIERKTTRARVTRNELLGRDGIDNFYTTPWTQDEYTTSFEGEISSSDSIHALAGSFSSPTYNHHKVQNLPTPQQQTKPQQTLLHRQPRQGKSERQRHRTRIVPGGRTSPTLTAIGTHEMLTTAEFVEYSNNTITTTEYPNVINEEMEMLLSDGNRYHTARHGGNPWH